MSLCRVCLTHTNGECVEIFSEHGRNLNMASILSQYFWFQIIENDGISTIICSDCWNHTIKFHQFYSNVQHAHQEYFQDTSTVHIDNCDASNGGGGAFSQYPSNNINGFPLKQLVNESKRIVATKLDEKTSTITTRSTVLADEFIKQEILDIKNSDDGERNLSDNCFVSIEENCIVVKEQSYTSLTAGKLTDDDMSDVDENNDYNDDSVDHLVIGKKKKKSPKKNCEKRKRITRNSIKKTKKSKTISSDEDESDNDNEDEDYKDYKKYKNIKNENNDEDNYSEDDDDGDDDEDDDEDDDDDDNDDSEKSNNDGSDKNETKPIVRKRVRTKRTRDRKSEDREIAEFCHMFCDICCAEFKTFKDALKHYDDKHQIRGYLICCEVKLKRRDKVLNHINRHINPHENHCNVCDKTFCDKFGLKRHMNSHKTEEEKLFKCVQCSKRYANDRCLANHILTVHGADEDRNVACDQCDKKFFTKIQLSAHIKRVHNSATEICDFCGKEFRNKYNLNIHRSETHLGVDSPKSQCNICGTWLKEKYLTKHLKRHAASVETCKVCNKVLQNRNSLNNHMRSVHSDRVHQCAICGKAFHKALSLKEHMALHTGEDLYTCPYCPKTFKSGANMHSHRKKAHFAEWERDRGKRLITGTHLL